MVHEEEDVERTPQDASGDYLPYTKVGVIFYHGVYYSGLSPAFENCGNATGRPGVVGQGAVFTPTSH